MYQVEPLEQRPFELQQKLLMSVKTKHTTAPAMVADQKNGMCDEDM
jgi:hypothetical protein